VRITQLQQLGASLQGPAVVDMPRATNDGGDEMDELISMMTLAFAGATVMMVGILLGKDARQSMRTRWRQA